MTLLAQLTAATLDAQRPVDGQKTAAVQIRQAAGGQESPEEPLERLARLEVVDVLLASALTELKATSGVSLAFSPSLLPSKTVSCLCHDAELHEALDRLLRDVGFRYAVAGQHVVIEPAPDSVEPPKEEKKEEEQEGTIRGRVTSAETGAPVEGAVVATTTGNFSSLTDPDGRYTIEDVPAGRYTLRVRVVGFERAERVIQVAVGETTVADFTLEVEAISLAGLTVEVPTELVTEQNVLDFPAARDVIGEQAIFERGAIYLDEVLATVPGIYIQDETGTGSKPNIGVRGLDPRRSQRVAILVDDVPLEPGPYGHTGLSIFPYLAERTRQIDILRGGVAVRHGPNTVGGVINILSTPIPRRPTALIKVAGGADSYASADVTYGNTWDRTGMLLEFVGKRGDGFRENSTFSMFNYNLKLRHEFDPTTVLSLAFDGYNEDSELPGGLSVDGFEQFGRTGTEHPHDYFDGYRYGGQAKLNKQFGGDHNLRFLSYVYRTFRSFGLDRPGGAAIRETPRWFTVVGVEPRYSVSLPRQTLTFGVRGLIEDVTFNRPQFPIDPATGERNGDIRVLRRVNYNAETVSFYADNKIQVSEELALHPGVRIEVIDLRANQVIANDEPVDIVNEQDFTEVLPGASVIYAPGGPFRLFANYHRAFRSPQYFQMERNEGRIPLQDLDGETSDNFEVGTRIGPASGLYGELFFFNIQFDNQVERDPLTENVFRSIGSTSHTGIESRLVWALGDVAPPLAGWELSGTYTFVDATIDSGEFEGNDAPRAPRHRGVWRVRYESPAGLGFFFEGQHVASSFQDAVNTVESEDARIGLIPAYDLFNAGAFFRLPRSDLRLTATVKNLTDDVYFTRDFRGIVPSPNTTFILGLSKSFNP